MAAPRITFNQQRWRIFLKPPSCAVGRFSNVGLWRERLGVESDAEMREWKASLCAESMTWFNDAGPEWRRLLLGKQDVHAEWRLIPNLNFRVHRISMALEGVDAMTAYRVCLQSIGTRQYAGFGDRGTLDAGKLVQFDANSFIMYETRRIAMVGIKVVLRQWIVSNDDSAHCIIGNR